MEHRAHKILYGIALNRISIFVGLIQLFFFRIRSMPLFESRNVLETEAWYCRFVLLRCFKSLDRPSTRILGSLSFGFAVLPCCCTASCHGSVFYVDFRVCCEYVEKFIRSIKARCSHGCMSDGVIWNWTWSNEFNQYHITM